jgi:hypothetical protein
MVCWMNCSQQAIVLVFVGCDLGSLHRGGTVAAQRRRGRCVCINREQQCCCMTGKVHESVYVQRLLQLASVDIAH